MTESPLGEAGEALLQWFDHHKRDLPWRRTRDPYAIWVSEIMLQQTRVAAVLDHYARWMQRFPTVQALAAAEETEVLALWSGLGYYRRARMLHRAAQAVVAAHGGELPRTAAGLRDLPGVGTYTSAAIASIAFGEEIAVVDGNVERVITRLAGLAPARDAALVRSPGEDNPVQTTQQAGPAALDRAIRALATTMVVAGHAGDSNQAMMEVGATVCLPRAPLCLHCPIQPWCRTRGEHLATTRKAQVARSISHGLAQRMGATGGEVLLQQRAADLSLMPGMWELPPLPAAAAPGAVVLQLRHAITVTNYEVSIVRLDAAQTMESARWFPASELPRLPLTGLTRKVLRRLSLWADS